MRDAQSILDQIISYSGNKINRGGFVKHSGIISEDIYFEFTEHILNSEILKRCSYLCQKVLADGYDLGEFLTGFEEHFRNLLVTKTLDSSEMISVSEHLQEKYRHRLASGFEENDLLRYISANW